MRSGSDRSIRQKLTRIVFITCGAAILLTCSIFALYDLFTFESSLKNELATLAEITASNTTAALSSSDATAASETLASLSAQKQIVEACLYSSDSSVLAGYTRGNSKGNVAFPKVESDREQIRGGYIVLFRQIRLDNKPLGTIYLKADLGALYSRGLRFVEILFVVILLSLTTAYFLSKNLQRAISEPILDLARAAFTVSLNKDYSIRATKRSTDEIGFLFDRFNEMMSRIQQHEQALQQAQANLEMRVDERTHELQKEVADRTRAEEKLAERTSFLNSLIENSPLAIVVIDPSRKLQMCNRAFESLFLHRQADILGRTIEEVVGSDERWEEAADIAREIQHRRPIHLVTQRKRSDGSPVDVELHAVPLVADGKVTGVLAMYQDITERIRAEEAMLRAKDAAEAASRAKSEFLANMSHEIRTPMNGILGMTELALDTQLSVEQRDYLMMVKSSADSLLVVLNDILDFSKIEAGKLDLELTEFSLRQSLGETLKTLGFRAHQKGLELTWRVANDVPDRLVGDVGRLRQVVVNLVGNALKFTQEGEVAVEVKMESAFAQQATFQFAVRDTGIGIAPEKQALIFEPFTQADSSTTRKYGGTGLGLGIAARLVEMMNGKIWVQSELARGSTFHFTIQFGVSTRNVGAALVPTRALNGMHALVVDDNATNRMILFETLSHWGMQPKAVRGFSQALAGLQNARLCGEPFSVLITDMQMPDKDGFDLIEAVRRIPDYDGLPILILSSTGPSGEGARLRRLNVAAYLTKPVQPSELLDAILNATHRSTGDAPLDGRLEPEQESRRDRSGLTVLLAEDNTVNRMLAKRLLEKHGHSVLVAENGQEVLERLDRDGYRIAVVLMDIQMPQIDGLSAIRAIRTRELETRRHMPIIALTAHAMRGDRERCLEAGADNYLTKPLHTPDLLAALDRIKEMKTEASSESSQSQKNSTNAPSPQSFELAEALQRLDGDRELLEEVLRLFVDEWPKTQADIQQALDAGEATVLERLAHSLKGASANLGGQRLSQAAFETEKLAKVGKLEKAREQWGIVKDEAAAFLAESAPLLRNVAL